MPRIIVKCRYYQTDKTRKNIGGLMRYVATRENVDKRTDEWKNQNATDSQRELIDHILTTMPQCQKMSEYGYYAASKTRGDAYEFISATVESFPQLTQENSYLKYMATRPRVDKGSGKHGLFSDSDKPLDLEEEVEKIQQFDGNVFTLIVSLKREDAARLGYDNANRWKDFVRSQVDYIAEQFKIPKQDLRWYGAFHNESHHPHIHLLLYSTSNTLPGYISKKGLNNLRHLFGTRIFEDDLHKIYDQQTIVRKKLTEEMRNRFRHLIESIRTGKFIDNSLLSKLEELAQQLSMLNGKKQYGYLPRRTKALVDEIVNDISSNDTIDALYDIWYKAKCAVYETYTDEKPAKLPLSQEKAFKAIRNALVYEASRLSTQLRPYDKIQSGIIKRPAVLNAALRFGQGIARVFEDNYRRYDLSDDEDIDRQLRKEIQAVKNGENLVM